MYNIAGCLRCLLGLLHVLAGRSVQVCVHDCATQVRLVPYQSFHLLSVPSCSPLRPEAIQTMAFPTAAPEHPSQIILHGSRLYQFAILFFSCRTLSTWSWISVHTHIYTYVSYVYIKCAPDIYIYIYMYIGACMYV